MSSGARRLEIPLLIPEGPGAPSTHDERRRVFDHFLRHLRAEPGVREPEIVSRDDQAALIISVDERLASLASLERLTRHCGLGFRQRWATVVLGVQGMVSPQSEDAIEAALAGLPHVRASASYTSGTVRVEFDRASCQLPEIALRLGRLGFRVYPTSATSDAEAAPLQPLVRLEESLQRAWLLVRAASNNPLIEAVAGAACLATGFVAESAGASGAVTVPLYLLSYFAAGSGAARDTLISLSRLRLNIDVLMFVAAIGAGAIGRLPEGALLLVLFAFGHAGESIAMEKARKAIKALHEVAPDTALLRDASGATRAVPVESLRVGDTILVRPGDRVAADGRVASGLSAVDQSPITGEATPIEKAPGSHVFAGTLNGDGALEVIVEKPHSETTLAKAIRLVEEAQTNKSPSELLAARVERYYVPTVLAATGLLLVIPPVVSGGALADWGKWFYRSMAFLTGASPCALAIGAPATVLAALARAARMGVLIKGGAHLETLGRLRAVAFDKTGTLTRGSPRVVAVTPLGDLDERGILAIAASVEAASAHPLAHSIVNAARSAGWDGRHADSVEQIVGKGLRGVFDGARVEVGSPRLFEGVSDAAPMTAAIEARRLAGETAVGVRVGGKFVGVIALADEPRENAAAAIAELRSLGVSRCIMLTGDAEGPAAALAQRLGLDEHHAGLLPEDKMRILAQMRESLGFVAMVGDGVNDAPALASASVGVAMAAAGSGGEAGAGPGASDVALETADVALMHDDLARFPDAVRLAKLARRIIAQNVAIALGVIAILAPAAALGYAPIGVAVVFHEGSTVVVVLNALRLLAFAPPVRRSVTPGAPTAPRAASVASASKTQALEPAVSS